MADGDTITLVSHTRGAYQVVYRRYQRGQTNLYTLRTGWPRFARDHGLRRGDVLEMMVAADPAGAGAGGGGGGRPACVALLVRIGWAANVARLQPPPP